MSPSDYLDLALRVLVLGVVTFGVMRALIKPWLARRARGRRMSNHARTAALVTGLFFALLPRVWPAWLPPIWSALLGLSAGSLSVGIHHAVEAALPEAISNLLTGGKGLLGGPQYAQTEQPEPAREGEP